MGKPRLLVERIQKALLRNVVSAGTKCANFIVLLGAEMDLV